MPLSNDVSLPIGKHVLFPDACVGCAAESPERTVTLRTWRPPLGSRLTRVPACARCVWGMRLAPLRRWGCFLAAFAAAAWASGGSWIVLVLLGGLLSLPHVVWETVRPPAIRIIIGTRRATYHFRRRDCAQRFATLNDAHVG